MDIVISGTGLFTPKNKISNDELVESFNRYVDSFNKENKEPIEKGEIKALEYSSAEFIVKSSGIKQRYVLDKKGILNPEIMRPQFEKREDSEISIMAEMAVISAKEALEEANKSPEEIDSVIVACSNMERAYPAIAVEIQNALGINGFAFDMNVACSSATFAIQQASDSLKNASAKTVLVVNPEICSGHLNFRDRDSHFIFGDACTAMIIENKDTAKGKNLYQILGTKLLTKFSNNIRNNFGYLSQCTIGESADSEYLFKQNGRKVFREVVPTVISHIQNHLDENSVKNDEIKRYYLHQANKHMNDMIAKKLMGDRYSEDAAPLILDTYANTSSAGSIIAFHLYKNELESGELSVISSFGAGYSVGSVIIQSI
jgi:beta-ketodecanoyl-[acyl-carrier-protein] synthase